MCNEIYQERKRQAEQIEILKKRLAEALEKDDSHTKRLSKN